MNLELRHSVDKLKVDLESALGNRIGTIESRAEFATKVTVEIAGWIPSYAALHNAARVIEYVEMLNNIDSERLFTEPRYRTKITVLNSRFLKLESPEVLKCAHKIDTSLKSESTKRIFFEKHLNKIKVDLTVFMKSNRINNKGTKNSANLFLCGALVELYVRVLKVEPNTKKSKGKLSPFDRVSDIVAKFSYEYIKDYGATSIKKNSSLMGSTTIETTLKRFKVSSALQK